MTLEEAIKHEEEIVKEEQYEYQECVATHNTEGAMNCRKYAEEHRQLAKWLKDYKRLLEQEPQTGHWVDENISEGCRKVFCSECGCPPPFEHISTGDVYSANGYGVINKTKFCPNCGVKMKSEG